MRAEERKPRPAQPVRLPRRRSDRLDDAVAWLVCSLALLTVLGAIVLGIVVHGHMAEQSRLQAADRQPVEVVLTEDVPLAASDGTTVTVPTQVRWTGQDGIERTGIAQVKGPRPAGSTVQAWTTDDGRLVHAPLTATEALLTALVGGLVAALASASVVAVVAQLAGRWTTAVHAAEWEREWERIEPRWTNRAGHDDEHRA
ncbi:MAG: hypothetical protein JWP64_1623 [Pseudonocardia sp.]|jgi:hypothetical protein|uniref:Rv1733c family protein n=1 Tax=Pseudonocardia sp. TaxID=60912 RepID=UPI00261BBFD4|nr:hypothetical protein [Pseudonocardia sp.]MCU1626674.1 hypothetical protein [Pseudonocardia sp.]